MTGERVDGLTRTERAAARFLRWLNPDWPPDTWRELLIGCLYVSTMPLWPRVVDRMWEKP